MSKANWKPGNMLYPLPVVMISCAKEGCKPNIITVAWTGTICSDPVMVSISVRKERYSHDIIADTGEFVINLVTEDLTFATDYCGVKSGRDTDKFTDMKLTPVSIEGVSVPAIKESPLSLACKVKEIKELKHYAESSQDPDGDFCRMLAVLNSFLSSNRFSWFLAYIVKAERAAKQTRDAYKPFEDQKRAKKPGLPTGPVSFADRESYGYAKYLCISNFEKMLDAFCKVEDLDV